MRTFGYAYENIPPLVRRLLEVDLHGANTRVWLLKCIGTVPDAGMTLDQFKACFGVAPIKIPAEPVVSVKPVKKETPEADAEDEDEDEDEPVEVQYVYREDRSGTCSFVARVHVRATMDVPRRIAEGPPDQLEAYLSAHYSGSDDDETIDYDGEETDNHETNEYDFVNIQDVEKIDGRPQ